MAVGSAYNNNADSSLVALNASWPRRLRSRDRSEGDQGRGAARRKGGSDKPRGGSQCGYRLFSEKAEARELSGHALRHQPMRARPTHPD